MLNDLKPMHVVLYGAIVVVIGGVFSALGSYFHNVRSSAKTDKIIELQDDVIKTQADLLNYSDSLRETQAKLLEVQTEADKQSRGTNIQPRIYQEITNQRRKYQIFIENVDPDYPIFDVLFEYKELNDDAWREMKETQTGYIMEQRYVGTITAAAPGRPSVSRLVLQMDYGNTRDSIVIRYVVSWRNGAVDGRLKAEYNDSEEFRKAHDGRSLVYTPPETEKRRN